MYKCGASKLKWTRGGEASMRFLLWGGLLMGVMRWGCLSDDRRDMREGGDFRDKRGEVWFCNRVD